MISLSCCKFLCRFLTSCYYSAVCFSCCRWRQSGVIIICSRRFAGLRRQLQERSECLSRRARQYDMSACCCCCCCWWWWSSRRCRHFANTSTHLLCSVTTSVSTCRRPAKDLVHRRTDPVRQQRPADFVWYWPRSSIRDLTWPDTDIAITYTVLTTAQCTPDKALTTLLSSTLSGAMLLLVYTLSCRFSYMYISVLPSFFDICFSRYLPMADLGFYEEAAKQVEGALSVFEKTCATTQKT